MRVSQNGIHQLAINDHPIAIIDFETTGLSAGYDRVIEISVLRVEPNGRSSLVLDSLVNPCRAVDATEIHGITDEDVRDAPIFAELVDPLSKALDGCIVCAYNVYFDMRFLEFELANARVRGVPPHFCLMYMRPMLGLGKRCSLEKACAEHGIGHASAHIASEDVVSSGKLLSMYLEVIKKRDIRTYGDLCRLAKYKFLDSFGQSPFEARGENSGSESVRLKSRRTQQPEAAPPKRNSMTRYWDELCIAVADLGLDDEEIFALVALRKELGISADEIRFLHAHLFNTAVTRFIQDRSLTDDEASKLRRLKICLRQLGWAPGD